VNMSHILDSSDHNNVHTLTLPFSHIESSLAGARIGKASSLGTKMSKCDA
jgi:hypothetical protein